MFGYHGKLIKLAGGIFHTHNHLADARIEILVYLAMKEKVSLEIIYAFMECMTIDDAFKVIEKLNFNVAKRLLSVISDQVEIRSMEYIQKYLSSDLKVGAVLFDRNRKIQSLGKNSQTIFPKIFTFKS